MRKFPHLQLLSNIDIHVQPNPIYNPIMHYVFS